MSKPINRRKAVSVAIGGGLILGHFGVNAISPIWPNPTLEDYVKKSDLIVLGVIEKIIFRGTEIDLPHEYREDFVKNNDAGTRAKDVFVRVIRGLKNNTSHKIPRLIRMQNAAPFMQQEVKLGNRKIFFLNSGALLKAGNERSRLFNNITDAVRAQEEGVIRKLVAQTENR